MECIQKVPFVEFYRERFSEWKRAILAENPDGEINDDAEQYNYIDAARLVVSSMYFGGRPRIIVEGEEADYINRDLIYQWLAKHAQRSAILTSVICMKKAVPLINQHAIHGA